MIRLLGILLLAFKIWMLVDALRRREPYYWLMIIFFIPFGSVIYFFMVKIKDFDVEAIAARVRRPPSVAKLRAAYQRTPSLDRLVELAEGLNAAGEHEEAASLFREVLGREPDNPDALFGLGEACARLGDHDRAVELLSKVIDAQHGYRDYAAWPLLAFSLYTSGKESECLSKLRELVALSPRLNHSILLAHYLISCGAKAEARAVLTIAIEDHRSAPRFVRRGQFRAVLEAKRMLKTCAG